MLQYTKWFLTYSTCYNILNGSYVYTKPLGFLIQFLHVRPLLPSRFLSLKAYSGIAYVKMYKDCRV